MIQYNYHNIKLYGVDKSLAIYTVQIMALYNATLMGWKIKKIGTHKYMLSKQITLDDDELQNFLYNLLNKSKSIL